VLAQAEMLWIPSVGIGTGVPGSIQAGELARLAPDLQVSRGSYNQYKY
jgi:hypothetical protein